MVHVELSVMGLSAPHVAEASIAVVWDSRSHPEAAKSDSTADREPSLQYANDFVLLILILSTWGIFHFLYCGTVTIVVMKRLCEKLYSL